MSDPVLRRHAGGHLLLWLPPEPLLCITSASVGGGIGVRNWIINTQVPLDYARTDIDDHLMEIATAQHCAGRGVGMLTAAAVDKVSAGRDGDVCVHATVGITKPTWAADADDAVGAWSPQTTKPGTINIVAFSPTRLSDAALVNAVVTVTEAKTQALLDAGVPGTGTASDAVCIACPTNRPAEPFGGPRSVIGARLARATYAAVAARAGGRS